MKHIRHVTLFSLLCLALSTAIAADAAKAIGKRAVSFTLEDQFEKSWAWDRHWKGRPTVLVLSDWKGSDYTEKWTQPLTRRFSDRVAFVALADVSLAPSFLKGYLRGRFRDAYTSYSVLLDWDGDVFTHYNVRPGLPNVIFIDTDGIVRLHTWGTGSPDHVNTFGDELERMIR